MLWLIGVAAGNQTLKSLHATDVLRRIYAEIGITASQWPLSFAGAIESLNRSGGIPIASVLGDSGYGPDSAGDAIQTGTHRPAGIRAFDIGISAANWKRTIQAGFPIAAGVSLQEGWYTPQCARDGVLATPAGDARLIDGMGIIVTGWEDSRQSFRFRFPQGYTVGADGWGWIPYAYLSDHALVEEAILIDAIYTWESSTNG